jgi:hypothetical protein
MVAAEAPNFCFRRLCPCLCCSRLHHDLQMTSPAAAPGDPIIRCSGPCNRSTQKGQGGGTPLLVTQERAWDLRKEAVPVQSCDWCLFEACDWFTCKGCDWWNQKLCTCWAVIGGVTFCAGACHTSLLAIRAGCIFLLFSG